MFRIFLVLVVVAVARIGSTYVVFNHTVDEPGFIACGLEWLTQRTYTYLPEQPPLSHIPVAIGAWLAGAHTISKADFRQQRSPYILYDSPSYYRTLAAARVGTLPFFILAAVVVWLWARRLYGNLVAVVALLLFTSLPPILAHAGLATTDMAACATYVAALYAFIRWLDGSSYKQSILLGLAIAAGVLSKFSFLLFFPISVAVVLALRGNWGQTTPPTISRRLSLAIVSIVCVFVVWAGNWFSFEPLNWGILAVQQHNSAGHPSYLFGEQRVFGWWYFLPVVLLYKTPLAFLALALLACIWLRREPREHWIPLACAAAILVSVMHAHINLGVRHILAIYPLLAILAGLAAVRLVESAARTPRILGGFLILWQLAVSAGAHPNYIAYFNELAAGRPERVRVDSDLDWGQSLDQLSRRVRVLGIAEKVQLGGSENADPSRHGLAQASLASPWNPSNGWIAMGATERFMSEQEPPPGCSRHAWSWLDHYEPIERIGGGAMLLYHIQSDVQRPVNKR